MQSTAGLCHRCSVVTLLRTASLLLALGASRDAFAQAATDGETPAMRACNAMRRAAQAQVDRAVLRIRRGATLSTYGYNTCHASGQSAWLVVLDRPLVRNGAYGPTLADGEVNVWHFGASGAPVRAARELLGEFGRAQGRPPSTVTVVEDFDRDGVGELVFVVNAPDARVTRALSARDGAVRAFAFETALRVNELVDVDRDGARDLVENVRFARPEACDGSGAGVQSTEAISFVAVRDGAQYRSDNDGARAWLRAQCPAAPAVIVPHHGVTNGNAAGVFAEAIRRVACARVWGMSAEAIARTFPRRWPTAWSCTNAAEIQAFAASVRAPLTLAPAARFAAPAADDSNNVEEYSVNTYFPDNRPTSEATPVVARACAANAQQVHGHFAAIIRQSRQSVTQESLDEFFGEFGTCFVSASRDAWTTSLLRLRWEGESMDDETGFTGLARVTHLSPGGASLSDRPSTVEHYYDTSSLRQVLAVFDYDGDGSSEAFVRGFSSAGDSREDSSLTVLTARGGAVRPYAPPGGLPSFTTVVDHDDDARPDLLSWREFDLSSDDEGGSVSSIALLFHSRVDGTFSRDDATAREFVREQCTAPPARMIVLDDDEFDRGKTLSSVVCARMYGESSDRIVQRIYAEAGRLDEFDRDWVQQLAQASLWRVPFTIAARAIPTPVQRADGGVAP